MVTQSVVLEEGIDEDYEPSSEGTPDAVAWRAQPYLRALLLCCRDC